MLLTTQTGVVHICTSLLGFVTKELKSDPHEKPLDQSAIPLIALSQLQPRLYQNIQNLDVLLISSLEI